MDSYTDFLLCGAHKVKRTDIFFSLNVQVSTLDQTENHVLMCMVLYAFLVFGNLKDIFVKDRSAAHVAVQAAGICLQQSTYTPHSGVLVRGCKGVCSKVWIHP